MEQAWSRDANRGALRDSGCTLALGLCLAAGLMNLRTLAAPSAAPGGSGFSFEALRQRARESAAKEYHPEPGPELPEFLKSLTFDQYQDIRFRPDAGPWAKAGLPFDLQFFHRGFIYKEPVRIHLIEDGQVHGVQFAPGQFDYDKNKFPTPVPAGLDYAGLRIIYRPSAGANPDEVASFLGASYFRLVGLHQRYGAASRGLAIDTGEPGGEEFPRFSEFWVERPGKDARALQLYALLESPSTAGAYRFVIHPGEDTLAEVEASLFVRKGGKKLGFAPLTSMFLMGENRTRCVADYRPEVHDSDGLLLEGRAGEWLWRPLVNPEKKHHISPFPGDDPPGFGLLQRDRDFDHYQDLEARYELRPSLWVRPLGAWGPGRVELVEIPSPAEWNDNMVAYWVPKTGPGPGQEIRLSYRLSASLREPETPGLWRVLATRINPEHEKNPPRVLVDFAAGGVLRPGEGAAVEAKVQASRGEVRNLVTQTNEAIGGWRAFFDLVGAGSEPVELRLWLQHSNRPVSETWLYHFQAP